MGARAVIVGDGPPKRAVAADAVERLTRWADDFPTPGVRFADLTPVLADPDSFRQVIGGLAAVAPDADLVAGIDARGFLLGSGVALEIGCGVLAVRKGAKLPPPVHGIDYSLEYGTARLEIPADGIDLHGKRVLLIDDVLATGGTLVAAADLLTQAGANVIALAVVLEIEALAGYRRVENYPLTSLLRI